jgi:hypothetical protein
MQVLMVGQVFPYETPVAGWLESDPAFDFVVVPVRRDTGGWTNYPEEEAKRYVRLYFPRTFDRLVYYDFLCYVDTYFGHLTGNQIDMMYRAIRDEGLGGLTTLGGGISWVDEYRTSWANSKVGDAFPTNYLQPPGQIKYVEPFAIKLVDSPTIPPVFTPFSQLGIEGQVGRQAAELGAKDGATTFATMIDTMITLEDTGMPFAVAWDYGEGTTWSVATDIQSNYNLFWTRHGGGDGYQYAMDLFLNMLLYSTGRETISDILRFHSVREQFAFYMESKSILFSLLEFVEKFGASRVAIDGDLEVVDEMHAEAMELYLNQDIDGALDALERVFDEMDVVSLRTMVLKDRALLWVYIVEWAVVTATLMICGFALWTIMIKRRLYREAGLTRAA